jgi:ribosomal protein L11 methylase PrmA
MLETAGLLDYVRPGGRLILSGIIDEQQPQVEAAIAAAGGTVVDRLFHRDWVTIVAQSDGDEV